MIEDEKNENEKNEADGPGEAVLDEPTAHALDPEGDPNTEWEQKAVDQVEGATPSSGSDSGPEEEGTEEDSSEDASSEAAENDSAEDSDEPA